MKALVYHGPGDKAWEIEQSGTVYALTATGTSTR